MNMREVGLAILDDPDRERAARRAKVLFNTAGPAIPGSGQYATMAVVALEALDGTGRQNELLDLGARAMLSAEDYARLAGGCPPGNRGPEIPPGARTTFNSR